MFFTVKKLNLPKFYKKGFNKMNPDDHTILSS